MRKGQKKRVWTPEQKSEIVHKHLDEHVSVRTLEREEVLVVLSGQGGLMNEKINWKSIGFAFLLSQSV